MNVFEFGREVGGVTKDKVICQSVNGVSQGTESRNLGFYAGVAVQMQGRAF